MKKIWVILFLVLTSCASFLRTVVPETTRPKPPPAEQIKRLEEAAVLERKGQPETAEEIYRSVREMNFEKHPGLAALAEWRMSYTAEMRGDDLRALAHLVSAEKRKDYLPENIAIAELPSRKAMMFYRLDRPEEALQSLQQAERGLKVLLSGSRAKPNDEWLARLYFEMGQSLSSHVTEENFTGALKAQEIAQSYLLKSIAQNQPKWSVASFETLKTQYNDFWDFLIHLPTMSGVEPRVALRQRRDHQIAMLAQFSKVIEDAQALSPVVESSANPTQKEVATFLQQFQADAHRVLYSNSESTVLTQESQVLNGSRRAGQILQPARKSKDLRDPNL